VTEEKSDTATPRDAGTPKEKTEQKKAKQKQKGGGPLGAVWGFFSSVHLAVILLLILAAVSIIGTVLAQGDSAADNIQLFENFLVKVYDLAGVVDADDPASVAAQAGRIRAGAERLYRFSIRASFTNLYHAWYFYLLLAFFSLNIIICSVKRWPITWRLIARNETAPPESRLRAMSSRHSLTLDLSREAARDRVLAAMKKARYSTALKEVEGAFAVFGQKGVASRLGVYATHLSIIVILIGGIIGVTNGFKGYMQIVEGTSERRFYDRRAKTTKLLPFEVRCDNFQVDYYGDSTRPKDFFSDLVVVQDGEEMLSKRIEVNDPLVWDDIWFYQSSYGDTGRGTKVTLRITDPATGEAQVQQLDTRPVDLPEQGGTLQVIQVLPDFALDNNQQPYAKSNQPVNPAALVEFKAAEGEARRIWLFRNYPDVQMVKDFPLDLTFVDYGGVQYTGLQVVYDPGVWVIWTGCAIMVIGIYLAFFIAHRRLWVRIGGGGGDGPVTVLLGGNANKNRDSFVEELSRLADRIAGGEEKTKKE
jgi:cytochrome c biogenesis protein